MYILIDGCRVVKSNAARACADFLFLISIPNQPPRSPLFGDHPRRTHFRGIHVQHTTICASGRTSLSRAEIYIRACSALLLPFVPSSFFSLLHGVRVYGGVHDVIRRRAHGSSSGGDGWMLSPPAADRARAFLCLERVYMEVEEVCGGEGGRKLRRCISRGNVKCMV